MKVKIFRMIFLIFILIGCFNFKTKEKDINTISILKNGDFKSGNQNWILWTNEKGEGEFTINNQKAYIKVKNPGERRWSVGLTNNGFQLIQNKTYSVEFEAKADSPIEIISLTYRDKTPFLSYSIINNFKLTGLMQKYSFTFKMIYETDNNSAFQIQLGGQSQSIIVVDNVTIKEIEESESGKGDITCIEDMKVKIRDKPLSLLRVKGNKIVDIKGNTVILHGVNLGDPNQLSIENHFTEDYFYKAASWGADVVRIPISPGDYRSNGKDLTFQRLDTAINWAEKYGMYIIIDWHVIGNPITKVFFDPIEAFYCTQEEMEDFWKTAARRYKDRPATAFYEIFNEPAALDWIKKGDKLDWTDWRDFADNMINVIYKENPKAIPIVGCLSFCNDLSDVAKEPLRNKGIVFAIHPYPGNIKEPFVIHCDKKFGFASVDYPLFFTEVGFDPYDKIYPDIYRADIIFGDKITSYANSKGISWTAYTFYLNPFYPMPLYSDWTTYKPTVQGAYFKNKMID